MSLNQQIKEWNWKKVENGLNIYFLLQELIKLLTMNSAIVLNIICQLEVITKIIS